MKIYFFVLLLSNSIIFHVTESSDFEVLQAHIFKELPWRLKNLLYKEMFKSTTTTPPDTNLRTNADDDYKEGMVFRNHHRLPKKDVQSDDAKIKLKLIRLMYEIVRDVDEKVKKVVAIKNKYKDSTYFELGFTTGNIIDKYHIMIDTTSTLKKLYDQWPGIEHVNAYEEISSQAIDISNLIQEIREMKKAIEMKEYFKNSTPANQKKEAYGFNFKQSHGNNITAATANTTKLLRTMAEP